MTKDEKINEILELMQEFAEAVSYENYAVTSCSTVQIAHARENVVLCREEIRALLGKYIGEYDGIL